MARRDVGVAPGPLPEWGPTLVSWLDLQQRYLDRQALDHDASWIYGERTSLSVLAAAAWTAGGIALEEFSTSKKTGSKVSEIPVDTSAQGRCDLFVKIRKRDYLIEAKASWPSLRGNAGSRISAALEDAVRDVRRNWTYRGATRLGAVFIAPYIPQTDIKNAGPLVDAFLGNLRSMCAVAWFFPQSTREFVVSEDGRSYPGVAVLIKPLRGTR